MSHSWRFGALVCGLMPLAGAQAFTAQSPTTTYYVCWSNLYSSQPFVEANQATRLLNAVQESAASLQEAREQWSRYAENAVPSLVLGSASCRDFRRLDQAEDRRADLASGSWRGTIRPVDVPFSAKAPVEVQALETPAKKTDLGEQTLPVAADAQRSREEREAEWKAKLDKYEADKAAWEATLAAQKAAEERKRAAHEAAKDAAAREKAAHEAKMAAHRRELDEANRRQQEYFAAQRRHALCVNGERQYCDQPGAEQLADAGDASTDTDATTCVSRPAVSGNATFEGNTAAMVVNGCETAVDVKICLMREGGWNCGMVSGLQPQDRWSHSSFKSSGEIFWDARVSGSNEPLASPGGN